MNKRRRPLLPETKAFDQLDVSPLIDVSFLLLIFFLVTSAIRKSETDLPMRIPADSVQCESIDTLTVDIEARADGLIRFNGTQVASDLTQHSLPALVSELRQAKVLAQATDSPILASIDIDDETSQQRFADVLNALTAAGIENIALKTNTGS